MFFGSVLLAWFCFFRIFMLLRINPWTWRVAIALVCGFVAIVFWAGAVSLHGMGYCGSTPPTTYSGRNEGRQLRPSQPYFAAALSGPTRQGAFVSGYRRYSRTPARPAA